ncbi:hypothetical protein V4S31_05185 [Enterococcus cecorum]
MSLSDLTREFFRQLQEMGQFKLNLLFANLSIVIMVSGYLDYFTATNLLKHSFSCYLLGILPPTVSRIQRFL